jgi:Lysylphosphatidylglycerol synthase TM region
MMSRLKQLIQSRVGRLIVAAAGLSAVLLLIRHSGTTAVWSALSRAAYAVPLLLLLEIGVCGCDMAALRLLYGEERKKIPLSVLIRAALIGYPVMCLVPIGRSVAEVARAALLARHTSVARAAAAATRLQGLLLFANAAISFPCAAVALWVLGPSWLPAAIAGNGLLCAVLGFAVVLAGRRSRIGAWIARRSKRATHFGSAFDDHLRNATPVPPAALALTCGTRVFQVIQHMIMVVAVGGKLSVINGMLAEAVHLVGSAMGDLIPAQLGATEANFTFAAKVLALAPGDAMAIALLLHVVQMFWTGVGSLVPLVWPASAPVAAPAPEPTPPEAAVS